MSIDYDTDVFSLFATDVATEDRYAQSIASVLSATWPAGATPVTATDQFDINTTTITLSGTTLATTLADIEAAGPYTPAITAAIEEYDDGQVLVLRSTQAGDDLVLAETTNTPLADLGIAAGTYTSDGDLPLGASDQVNEQRILTTIEVLASHMRLLRDRDEARLLHYCLSRLLTKAGSGGFVYDNLVSSVYASVGSPVFLATDDIRIQVVNPYTGANVLAATDVAAGGTALSDLISAINGASPGAADLTAVDSNGKLGLVSPNGWTIIVLQGGANDEATRKAGMEPGTYKNKAVDVADSARDEALAFFATEVREGLL